MHRLRLHSFCLKYFRLVSNCSLQYKCFVFTWKFCPFLASGKTSE
uniref:Uncharacterized protein n=1 Tax=Arundo donax TaxID=35708 RepID=A0A0A9AQI2_ARUDO